MLDAENLARELSERGKIRADRSAAFHQMQDSEKSVLAQYTEKAIRDGAKSQAAAEATARASSDYRDFLASKAKLRHAYELAVVNHESYKVYIELLRSNQSYEKAQMGLV
jgi:hypothetical protein